MHAGATNMFKYLYFYYEAVKSLFIRLEPNMEQRLENLAKKLDVGKYVMSVRLNI